MALSAVVIEEYLSADGPVITSTWGRTLSVNMVEVSNVAPLLDIRARTNQEGPGSLRTETRGYVPLWAPSWYSRSR